MLGHFLHALFASLVQRSHEAHHGYLVEAHNLPTFLLYHEALCAAWTWATHASNKTVLVHSRLQNLLQWCVG